MVYVLEKIKSNELCNTRFYDPNWEADNNSDLSSKEQSDLPHYDNLYLTKKRWQLFQAYDDPSKWYGKTFSERKTNLTRHPC
jgi:hypothetical protein